MHLLYCDETNMEARPGDFFVYAGLVVDGAEALALSQEIDRIRRTAGIDRSFRLKFLPAPENLTHAEFVAVKQEIVEAAVAHNCKLIASTLLHDIAAGGADVARRNEINRVCYHFECLLNRLDDAGLVLVDRFNDPAIDAHLAEKFCVGIRGPGLPFGREVPLDHIVGYHYSAIGQSHCPTVIDIVLGSLRFAINAFTRNDANRIGTAEILLHILEPLFYREPAGAPVSEISFFFSPKRILVPHYRAQYERLKMFLADNGIDTEQPVVRGERL